MSSESGMAITALVLSIICLLWIIFHYIISVKGKMSRLNYKGIFNGGEVF